MSRHTIASPFTTLKVSPRTDSVVAQNSTACAISRLSVHAVT